MINFNDWMVIKMLIWNLCGQKNYNVSTNFYTYASNKLLFTLNNVMFEKKKISWISSRNVECGLIINLDRFYLSNSYDKHKNKHIRRIESGTFLRENVFVIF